MGEAEEQAQSTSTTVCTYPRRGLKFSEVASAVFIAKTLDAASAMRALGQVVKCTVCQEDIDFKRAVGISFDRRKHLYLTTRMPLFFFQDPLTVSVCSTTLCYAVSHITCLAGSFLSQDDSDAIIPRGGHCSRCYEWTLWGDVIRGADRRKFGALAAEQSDEGTEEDEDEDEKTEIGLRILEVSPVINPVSLFAMSNGNPRPFRGKRMPDFAPRTGRENPKKAVATAKPSVPKRSRTKPSSVFPAGTPSRGRLPKSSPRGKRARRAAYSTSTFSTAHNDEEEEELEDFSALLNRISDVESGEDSCDSVRRALAEVTLTSPRRP